MSSLTSTPLLSLAPIPEATMGAASPRSPAVDVTVIRGDGTDLHPPHRAAVLPLIPGLAHTLAAIDGPPAVVVKATAGMDADGTAAHHHADTVHAVSPTAAHPPQTDTRITDTTGPAPGHPATRAGAGTRGRLVD